MKKSVKKIISMISMASVISTCMGSQIVMADETSSATDVKLDYDTISLSKAESEGKYATNPGGNVGKNTSISMGTMTEWNDDMLIAQGAAFDTATAYKGQWENGVMDSYSLYGAWDDENVYIAFQLVNVYDDALKDSGMDLAGGPLSCNGKPGNFPITLAIDTGKGNPMTGLANDGKGIWGENIMFKTRVDNILVFHANNEPTPGFFTADESGVTDYKAHCGEFTDLGVEVKITDGSLPKNIWGVKDNKKDLKAAYSDSSDWYDFGASADHNREYDTFYEVKIPYKALGIDKSYLESNGIGVMQLIGRGESGMDCIPHDPSMMDNVMGDYASQTTNSHEKDDLDIITVPLASIGKLRDGSVVPPTPDKKDAKITDFSADKKIINTGDEVKFTCTADNAVSYSFEIDGTEADSSEVKDNVLTHTFDKAGSYKVKVTAKAKDGKDDTKEISVAVTDKQVNPPVDKLKISDFTASPSKNVTLGNKVQLNATAEGGNGEYEYKFTAVDADDNETVISDFSDNGTAKWTPKKAGQYTLNVYAKENGADEKDAIVKSIEGYKVEDKAPIENKLAIDEFTASPDEGQIEPGTKVTFTGEASEDGAEYKYEVSKDGQDFEELELNDEGNGTAWTPEEEGSYKVRLTVSKDGFTDATETKSYTVKKKVVEEDKEFNPQISVEGNNFTAGSPVKLTVDPQNAHGDVTYKYVVKADNKDTEYSSKNETSENTFTFTPKEANTYKVYVIANDGTGQVKSNTVAIDVKAAADNNKNNDSLNITVDSKKGTVNKEFLINKELVSSSQDFEYKLCFKDSDKQIDLTEKNGKLSWTPDKAGTYEIYVVAKDENNNELKSDSIFVTINDLSDDTDVAGNNENNNNNNNQNQPTADNAPLKALGVMALVGASALSIFRKKQK